MNIEEMLAGYIECALWSSVQEDGDEFPGMALDESYGPDDLALEALASMREDVEAFARAESTDLAGIDPGRAGHDFWLTRNGHGAGFWDRGLGEVGQRLTDACRAYGTSDLYVGDDGKVYVS